MEAIYPMGTVNLVNPTPPRLAQAGLEISCTCACSSHVITKKRMYADLDYKTTDFDEDFEISVKSFKDLNQKCTRFEGESSPSGPVWVLTRAQVNTY